MQGYIYKIINSVNGKIYIGKTVQKLSRRFHQHIAKALKNEPRLRHIKLYSAIRKYGYKNFSIEELESMEVNSSKELNAREIYWISYYNSTDTTVGYNLTGGGDGGSNMLPETSNKIVNTKRQRGSLSLSDETKRKISIAKTGKKFTEEHKKHLSDNHHLKTTHILYYKDGHTEVSTCSVKILAEKLNTTTIKLRRASEVGEFRCGDFFLLDLTDLSLAFNHQYRHSKERCCIDPIRGDIVSHNTLRLRNQHNPLDYKGIVLYNFTKEKLEEKQAYIKKFEEIKLKALEGYN